MSPRKTVEAFIEAWNTMDLDTAYAMMADDIVWHNIPMEPAIGVEGAKALMEGFPAISAINWVTHHIAVNGNVVLTERTDSFTFESGKTASIRLMGAFEIDPDGKISKWRDYFDMLEFQREFGGE